MISKKRTFDIQFYRDVLEAVVEETSGKRKRISYADEDELEEEMEEFRRKEEADNQFENFASKICEASNEKITMEEADDEVTFPGIINRQTVRVRHTSEALVYITDYPPLIVSWSDIEIAFLERVLVNFIFISSLV